MDVRDIAEADMKTLTGQGYTAADLGMLADTEVQALLAPETPEGDGTDPHERAAAEQDAATQAAAAAAAAGNDTTPGAAASEAEPEPEPAQPTTFVPQYTAEVPADAAEQIAAEKKREREEFAKLMDGTIDADAYQKVREETDAKIEALRTAALTADIFNKANAQAAEQAALSEWKRAESASMNAFKAEGLDYRAKPGLMAAYNVHLKALGADPKNERRDAPWFLAEAHRLTKEELGITTQAKPTHTPGAPKGVAPEEIPPTLRSVPAAATNAVNADEFAHMRNLSGLALEKAHAALSQEQRDRWMAE